MQDNKKNEKKKEPIYRYDRVLTIFCIQILTEDIKRFGILRKDKSPSLTGTNTISYCESFVIFKKNEEYVLFF